MSNETRPLRFDISHVRDAAGTRPPPKLRHRTAHVNITIEKHAGDHTHLHHPAGHGPR